LTDAGNLLAAERVAAVAPAAVRLVLDSRAENVAVARQAIAGIAEVLSIDPAVLADIKVAVTEACANVVVHAYTDGDGTIELDATPGEDAITLTVRDRGVGMGAAGRRAETQGLGLGLALIASLSDTYAITGGADRGTEVRMTFDYGRTPDASPG
jgi:serine/threonine-protein kinase RsbW